MNRIILGGAQLGLPYGVLGTGEKLNAAEVKDLLDAAESIGIQTIDTAIAYGTSESVIGDYSNSRFKLITKLPPLPNDVNDVSGWVRQQIDGSLTRLQTNNIDALLLHHAQDLTGEFGVKLEKVIGELLSEGFIKRFGVSIYAPDELTTIVGHFPIDVVQTPFNVFDQRITPWLATLNRNGIEVHARSVFLQGLLISPANARPARFRKWEAQFNQFDNWVSELSMSAISVCLGVALNQPGISHLVVGALNSSQLLETAAQIPKEFSHRSEDMQSNDPGLIDPRVW
jgi:aryl-alcohol dehydrogenase-like predicted oxidoreductase